MREAYALFIRMAATAVGVAIVSSPGYTWANTGPASPSATSAAGHCGCPTLQPVANSAKPAPGKVTNQLSHAELSLIFSNRVERFGGDWAAALAALTEEIDTAGSLGLPRGQSSVPASRDVAIDESVLTLLLTKGPPRAEFKSGNPLRREADGGHIMTYVLKTLARSNKYGEPEFGLRKDLLRIARWMAGDLASTKEEAIRAGGKGAEVARLASAAGIALRSYLSASPRDIDLRRKSPRGGDPLLLVEPANAPRDTLRLDVFDMADAALDVLLSVDEDGKLSGLPAARTGSAAASLAPREIVRLLVGLASARTNFGGEAPRNSIQDVIACKAFTILVTLAQSTDGEAYRDALSLFLVVSDDDKRGPEHAVARAAFILAGVHSTAEADRTAKLLMGNVIVNRRGADKDAAPADVARLEAVMVTIRAIDAYAGGAEGAEYRRRMANALDKEFDGLRQRVKGGIGSAQEGRLADMWEASSASWKKEVAAKLCMPDAAPPRVLIFAKGVNGLLLIDKIYTGVPLVLGVAFPEPFDGGQYPVSLQIGGRTIDLVAKPADQERRLFQTDTFMVQP